MLLFVPRVNCWILVFINGLDVGNLMMLICVSMIDKQLPYEVYFFLAASQQLPAPWLLNFDFCVILVAIRFNL